MTFSSVALWVWWWCIQVTRASRYQAQCPLLILLPISPHASCHSSWIQEIVNSLLGKMIQLSLLNMYFYGQLCCGVNICWKFIMINDEGTCHNLGHLVESSSLIIPPAFKWADCLTHSTLATQTSGCCDAGTWLPNQLNYIEGHLGSWHDLSQLRWSHISIRYLNDCGPAAPILMLYELSLLILFLLRLSENRLTGSLITVTLSPQHISSTRMTLEHRCTHLQPMSLALSSADCEEHKCY